MHSAAVYSGNQENAESLFHKRHLLSESEIVSHSASLLFPFHIA